MKRLLLCVWLLPLFVQAERIVEFNSQISVELDGSLVVTETIVYDYEGALRRGIYRDIPREFNVDGTKRYLDIDTQLVTHNGQVAVFLEDTSWKEWSLRIGEEDVVLDGGVHTYEMTYRVQGALRYFDDLDELYWNITGDKWSVPMDQVIARVSLPQEVSWMQESCYQGLVGSQTACSFDNDHTFSVSNLSPGEQMTIAVGFTPDVVAVLENNWFWLFKWAEELFGAMFAAWIAWLLQLRWRKNRVDLPVVAQYETYEKTSPTYMGIIVDGNADNRDLSAGIIHLAQRGHLAINFIPSAGWFSRDDFRFTLNNTDHTDLDVIDETLLELLFGSTRSVNDSVLLSDLTNTAQRRKNSSLVGRFRAQMNRRLKDENYRESLLDDTQYRKQLGLAIGLAIVSVALAVIGLLPETVIFVAIVGAVTVVSLLAYRIYTEQGYRARNHILGYKLFLSVTEQERLAFHNAPEKNPDLFMEHLPYAMALGVDKEWSNYFNDMFIQMPDWYQSEGEFSSTQLVRALGVMGSDLARASTNPSSGSSGGGSAGGGGGGGGGGSW